MSLNVSSSDSSCSGSKSSLITDFTKCSEAVISSTLRGGSDYSLSDSEKSFRSGGEGRTSKKIFYLTCEGKKRGKPRKYNPEVTSALKEKAQRSGN